MSLAINNQNLPGINTNNKQLVAMPLYCNEITNNAYEKGLIEDGYGFSDGIMKGPYQDDATNSTYHYDNYCKNWAVLSGQPTGSTNYCLTADTELSFDSFVEDTEFSGILDGCGHTLTLTCNKSDYTANSAHAWGALIGTLTGTIRNIRIITKFYWQCTRSNGYVQYVGGVCGRITNGTLSNVYVEAGTPSSSYTYNMSYTARPTGSIGNHPIKMVAGIAGEITGNTTLTNVTVKINRLGWTNTDGGSIFGRPDVKLGVAGFVGHIASGSEVLFKNVSVLGTASLTSNCNEGGSNCYVHKGAFIAYSEGNVTFTNVKNAWTGSFTHSGGENGTYQSSMVGAAGAADRLHISNVYCTTNSRAVNLGWLEEQDAKIAIADKSEASIILPYQAYVANLDLKIGFLNDDFWIGLSEDVPQRYRSYAVSTMSGKYIDSITYSEAEIYTYNAMFNFSLNKAGIAKIPAELIRTDILNSYSVGYFGVLSNTKISSTSTTKTFRAYYNNGSTFNYAINNNECQKISGYKMYRRIINGSTPIHLALNTSTGYYNK